MIYIGFVIGLIELLGQSSLLAGTLALNSAGQAMWGYGKSFFEDGQDRLTTLENYDRKLDYADKKYGIYENGYFTREQIKNIAFGIGSEMRIDPGLLIDDIPKLYETGVFNSAEEAMRFDAMLRQKLIVEGITFEEFDGKMNEIFEVMIKGGDLKNAFIELGMDDIPKMDGKNITPYDVYNYLNADTDLLTDYKKIEENMLPEVRDVTDKHLGWLADRIYSDKYYEPATNEKEKELLPTDKLMDVEGIHFKYDKVEDRMIPYFEGVVAGYDYNEEKNINEHSKYGTVAFQEAVIAKTDLVEASPNKYNNRIYTIDDVNMYHQKKLVNDTGNIDKEVVLNDGTDYSATQYYGGLSEDEYALLDTISKNVGKIYTTIVKPEDQSEYEKDKLEISRYTDEMNLLDNIHRTVNNIYSAVVYTPQVNSNKDYEYIPLTPTETKIVNENANSELAELSNIDYDTIVDNVITQYEKMYGGQDSENVGNINTISMLQEIKDDLLFNTQINIADLMIDTQIANNTNQMNLMIYMVGLLEDLTTKVAEKSGVKETVIKTGGYSSLSPDSVKGLANGLRNTNTIVSSRSYLV